MLFLHHTYPDYLPPPRFSRRQVCAGPFMPGPRPGADPQTLTTPCGAYDVAPVVRSAQAFVGVDAVIALADATGANMPFNLRSFPGFKVLLVGDTHHLERPLARLIAYAASEPWDLVISPHNRPHLHFFKEAGVRNVYWLPNLVVDCPTQALPPQPDRTPEVFTSGQLSKYHPVRVRLVERLRAAGLPVRHLLARADELAGHYARAAVTLNCSLNGDLNMRVAEALAVGATLVTDHLRPHSGLDRLYSGAEVHLYRDAIEAVDLLRRLLADPGAALATARRGWARHCFDLGFPAMRRHLFRLMTRGQVDDAFDLRHEPRCRQEPTGDRPALARRIDVYQRLQELNRTREATVVALGAGTDPRQVLDLADLNRTRLVLEEGATAAALRRDPAFADCAEALTIVPSDEFQRTEHDQRLDETSVTMASAGGVSASA